MKNCPAVPILSTNEIRFFTRNIRVRDDDRSIFFLNMAFGHKNNFFLKIHIFIKPIRLPPDPLPENIPFRLVKVRNRLPKKKIKSFRKHFFTFAFKLWFKRSHRFPRETVEYYCVRSRRRGVWRFVTVTRRVIIISSRFFDSYRFGRHEQRRPWIRMPVRTRGVCQCRNARVHIIRPI